MRYRILYVFLLVAYTIGYSQNRRGLRVDNYSGIHSVVNNPANVVNSPLKLDVNVFSSNLLTGTDYINLDFGTIFSSDGFDFEDDLVRFPKDNNNFLINLDILGPSFMFNLSSKSSIGFITRGRVFFNLNNFNGTLFENIIEEFDTEDDFSFNSTNLKSLTHAWAEIGVSYGRILLQNENHSLSSGVTLKYLVGAGASFINSPNFQGQYNAQNKTLASQGTLSYGITQGFDDGISFDNTKSGLGLDAGFVYRWKPDSNEGTIDYNNLYKLKIGASITDIGKISYKNTEVTTYNLNKIGVSVDDFVEDDLDDFLEDNYNGVEETRDTEINLPTALHLLVDYRLSRKWLVSAEADLSIGSKSKLNANEILNTYTLTPRYETKLLSAYLPLSINEYDDYILGFGIRVAGVLTIGSGTIVSNILTNNSQTADIYLGLSFPFFKQ